MQNLQKVANFFKILLDTSNLVDLKMLQNAYLFAKIGADKAENNPKFIKKNVGKFCHNLPDADKEGRVLPEAR